MLNILLIGADQNLQTAWLKSQVIAARNTRLHSLLVVNKGADAWLEIYDHPSAATGEPIELPLTGSSYVSLAWSGGKQFNTGCFVRAVSSQGGALVATNDIKITAEFMDGPLP